jgi:sulfopyruvate decarboxylase subunit beta
MNPEDEVAALIKQAGVSIVLSLPCDRVKALHHLLAKDFSHVPLTREEEGVGIAAGLALAGERPAMLIQSSGLGNMVNALASLTMFYELPLFLLVSWRGVYKEGIAAQRPMGEFSPRVLGALGIDFLEVRERRDIANIGPLASRAFEENRVAAALLSPKIWEGSESVSHAEETEGREISGRSFESLGGSAKYTRFEVIKGVRESLRGRVVVCNLGVPCKELYSVIHQPSNFYMLGSMGMAAPVGLGIALGSKGDVVVIDGDGSLLMNPGVLATVAELSPSNLSILAVDNAAHGSTGNQPTATLGSADLALVARGMGIKNTLQALSPDEAAVALRQGDGPRFIHAIAKPGNATVKNIPLSPLEIKANVMGFLQK